MNKKNNAAAAADRPGHAIILLHFDTELCVCVSVQSRDRAMQYKTVFKVQFVYDACLLIIISCG